MTLPTSSLPSLIGSSAHDLTVCCHGGRCDVTGSFGLKNCPDSRPPRGQEWGELEGVGGGCEEFLDGMFLWRLSPNSAPAPSPSPRLGYLPAPAMSFCLFLPPKQQPTDTFFPSPPSPKAANMSYFRNVQAVISATPSLCRTPLLGPTQLAVGKCRHGESMHVFFGKEFEERMCSFPYPPCGHNPSYSGSSL